MPATRSIATTSSLYGSRYPTSYSRILYHDRLHMVRHVPHHLYTYHDPYHRLVHRIISPSYYCTIGYWYGPYHYLRWHYPYYHRKYIFVSLGGWWPLHYRYVRYYWYGWHPYDWYGYYPVPRAVDQETHNYYTYNYYSDQDAGAAQTAAVEVQPEAPPAQPEARTAADTYFEEAVKSFESGEYALAAARFGEAMELAPDDVIMPFAYSQSLFADGQYTAAAEVLRRGLLKVSPDQEGVFYPRGLYGNEDVLFEQLDTLLDQIDKYPMDADLQLLLGYHMLGVGELDFAVEPLQRASQDKKNVESARVLLRLLEKLRTEKAGQAVEPSTNAPTQSPAPQTPPQIDRPGEGIEVVPNTGGATTRPVVPPQSKAAPKDEREIPHTLGVAWTPRDAEYRLFVAEVTDPDNVEVTWFAEAPDGAVVSGPSATQTRAADRMVADRRRLGPGWA